MNNNNRNNNYNRRRPLNNQNVQNVQNVHNTQNSQNSVNNKNKNYSRNYNPNKYYNAPNYNYNANQKISESHARITRTVPYKYQLRKKPSFFAKYGVRIFIFLFFFVVVGGASLALFFFSLTRTSPLPDISYTVKTPAVKNGKEKINSEMISLSYNVGFANDRYYFPIDGIMEYLGFVSAGNEDDYSFIRENPNEYIKIILGTNIIYINGAEYHLPSPSFMGGEGKIYVPLEFIQANFENLTFTADEKNKNHITVDLKKIEDAQTCFRIHQIYGLREIEEADAPYFSSDPVKFKANLGAYEKYFSPPKESADEYIVLINQTHPLVPQDYIPPDLTDVADTRKDRAVQQMREYPEKALEAFLTEARANGFSSVTVTSAYRSYNTQVSTFNEELARMRPIYGDDAEKMTALAVAYPGQSEHQSGLCADMHSNIAAADSFGYQADGIWCAENAHYFGFIVRYPKDKTEITGIKYEPWHFRYVGRFHATKMYEMGLCLEEYYDQVLNK